MWVVNVSENNKSIGVINIHKTEAVFICGHLVVSVMCNLEALGGLRRERGRGESQRSVHRQHSADAPTPTSRSGSSLRLIAQPEQRAWGLPVRCL